MSKLNQIFADFVKKIELWGSLEDEYDYRKDQKKAQKKLEEIYESLKQHFTKKGDERMVQVEKFKKNLEGKIVPDHILKIVEEEINKYMMLDIGHSESSVT